MNSEPHPWSSLPPVAGGWTVQRVPIAGRMFELVQPAVPDKLLDDPQVLEANRRDDYMPYWSYLWPAAVPMAELLNRAPWPPDAEILELGCGVGLVGLAALALGGRVTFSDHDATAVECALLNARRNDVEERAAGVVLDWRTPLDRRWPVIIGCEVTYESRNHPILLDLIERMLDPNGICWLGDPGRSQLAPFIALARERRFQVAVRDQRGEIIEGPPEPARLQVVELRLGWRTDKL